MIKLLMTLCKFNFGEFEEKEFRKFVRMGFIYFMVVGIYWVIRPLKDTVFVQFVNKESIPLAKTVSLFLMIPFVAAYTKLITKYPREKVTVMVPVFYGVALMVFGLLVHLGESGVLTEQTIRMSVGYVWYFFVESWASVVFAMFWAMCTDVTDPKTAKRGFPLVYLVGQTAGIVTPLWITGLPELLGLKTNLVPILSAGVMAILMIGITKYFFKATPKELLVAFESVDNKKKASKEKEGGSGKKPGFTEGLKLLFSHKYLLSIFGVIFMFEFLTTIFDYNFKMKATDACTIDGVIDGVKLGSYLGRYSSLVNGITVAFLLLGVSNIPRYLGIGASLVCLPVLLGSALFGFLALDSLEFLLWVMVSCKALNYALNNPTLKQLYIPTSESARFKAQAWIEAFGGRCAKEGGSLFNMILILFKNTIGEIAGKARYLAITGWTGYPLIGLWIIMGVYLGKTWKKAVDTKKVVC